MYTYTRFIAGEILWCTYIDIRNNSVFDKGKERDLDVI